MKKLLAIILMAGMLLSFAACGNTEKTEAPAADSAEEVVQQNTPEAETESGGGLEVDRGLFNVTLTIPAEFLDEGKTQADYDVDAKENGFKSATLNEDGSVTYVMTRAQHEAMMSETRVSIEESLAGMSNNEDFPNFASIDTNADYTEFTVHCTTEELSFTESFSVLGFYMIGGMYNAFNGTPTDNIHVVFVNDATGAVISESNSADLSDLG